MNFQIAILDRHTAFIDRLKQQMESMGSAHLCIHRFEGSDELFKSLSILKPDLLISDRPISRKDWNKFSSIPLIFLDQEEDLSSSFDKCCLFALWTEEKTEQAGRIYRFQKAQNIYKDILRLLSQGKTNFPASSGEHSCKEILFGSFFGGTGVSSLAQACAHRWAKDQPQKRILYFDFDPLGSSMAPLVEADFSAWDKLYLSAKSRKSSLGLKMRVEEKKLMDSFYSFSYPKNPSSFFELNNSDKEEIYRSIQNNYEGIVLDDPKKWSFQEKEDLKNYFSSARKVLIWPIRRGKGKLERAVKMLSVQEEKPLWILMDLEGKDQAREEVSLLNNFSMPNYRLEYHPYKEQQAIILDYSQRVPWKELLDG